MIDTRVTRIAYSYQSVLTRPVYYRYIISLVSPCFRQNTQPPLNYHHLQGAAPPVVLITHLNRHRHSPPTPRRRRRRHHPPTIAINSLDSFRSTHLTPPPFAVCPVVVVSFWTLDPSIKSVGESSRARAVFDDTFFQRRARILYTII